MIVPHRKAARSTCTLTLLLCICLTALFSACSCERPNQNHKDVARAQVLATIGKNIITKADFQRALQQLSPFTRRQYVTHKRKAEFLEQLIQFELLIQEAKKRKFHKNEGVLRIKHRAMVGLLIKQVVQGVKLNTITPAALRKFYRLHYRDYNKPERRRAQQIFFRMSAKTKTAEWQQKVLAAFPAKLAQANATPGGFAALARKLSEDPVSRINGGDLGYQPRTQNGGAWAKSVSDAVFSIKKVGQIVGPIRSAAGFHFLRLAEIVKPTKQAFHKLQHVLRDRLRKARQKKAYRSFLAGLHKKYSVKIDQKLLLQVQPNPPAKPKSTKRPTPARPVAPARPAVPARPVVPTPAPTKRAKPAPAAPKTPAKPTTPAARPTSTKAVRPTPPRPTQVAPRTTQPPTTPRSTTKPTKKPTKKPTTDRPAAARRAAPRPTTRRAPAPAPRPTSRPASRPGAR